MTPRAERHTREALICLDLARKLRQERVRLSTAAYAAYGDHGSLISGVERDHFPEPVKDTLRANARAIGAAMDDAYTQWTRGGRRGYTFRALATGYRVDGCRY